MLPDWVVTAVVEVPGGAHPSYALGYYDARQRASTVAWDAIARDARRFTRWMDDHVLGSRRRTQRVPARPRGEPHERLDARTR